MAQELALELLNPSYCGTRIPVMEHPWPLSREAIQHLTGRDPLREPEHLNDIFQQVATALEIDLLWGGGLPRKGDEIYDWSTGPSVRRNAAGQEVVRWGIFATTHQEDGRHFTHVPKPADVPAALAFEPQHYFPESVAEYTTRFTQAYHAMLASCGRTCLPIPHHYTTCFHWPLAIFGFELLCEVGMEEEPFADLMTKFAEISTRITTAWAQVRDPEGKPLRAFICHDDLTITSGPIFSPDWYRRYIFPHYRTIFAPLKAAGIPIIFTSDGNCSAFVDDLLGTAQVDGLNFEYLVDLERLVRDYPDKILIGNINSAILAGDSLAALEAEVTRCLTTGARARRYVLNVGGGLTHDIPIPHLDAYLKLRKRLCRSIRTA